MRNAGTQRKPGMCGRMESLQPAQRRSEQYGGEEVGGGYSERTDSTSNFRITDTALLVTLSLRKRGPKSFGYKPSLVLLRPCSSGCGTGMQRQLEHTADPAAMTVQEYEKLTFHSGTPP